MYRLKVYLVLVIICHFFLLVCGNAMAAPVIDNVFFFTDREYFGRSSDTWFYQFGGTINSASAITSITAQDIYSNKTYEITLDDNNKFSFSKEIYPSYNSILKQIKITATNADNETTEYLTHNLSLSKLDYASNVFLTGNILTPEISWLEVPNVEKYTITVYDILLKKYIFEKTQAPSSEMFYHDQIPEGYLRFGQSYKIEIFADDIQNGILMNRSTTTVAHTVPVSEPSSALLLGMGILGLARLYRGKRP